MDRPEPDRAMSREQLEELARNLAMLSDDGVRRAYQIAYQDCRLIGEKLPPATAVQQLVVAWKRLRKLRDES